MKIKKLSIICACALAFVFAFTGCQSGGQSDAAGSGAEAAGAAEDAVNAYGLKDGTYVATFTTDNKMFHVNEANEDMGILTVENGEMTIHVSLQSKKVVNLFPGTAEDAQKDGAVLLEPTVDTVTYSDGISSEVYGFDIPVPAIDEEFDVALIGTHDNWYTHKVVVSNPVPGNDISEFLSTNVSEEAADYASMIPADSAVEAVSIESVEDGEYTIEVAMEGGTGRAEITSPTELYVVDGKAYAQIEWSSPNYDYMLVDGERFDPVNEDGNSVFLIPVTAMGEPMAVVGDTTAMSEAHEIDYTLTFDSESISSAATAE